MNGGNAAPAPKASTLVMDADVAMAGKKLTDLGAPVDATDSARKTHSHAESDITNLVSDLSGKAASTHGHAQSDITDLVTALAGKMSTTLPTPAGGTAVLYKRNTTILNPVGVTTYTGFGVIFVIQIAGTYRIGATIRETTGAGETIYARPYVNGGAAGTEHSTQTVELTFSDDVAVNAGDTIQMYAKMSAGGANAEFKNVILSVSAATYPFSGAYVSYAV